MGLLNLPGLLVKILGFLSQTLQYLNRFSIMPLHKVVIPLGMCIPAPNISRMRVFSLMRKTPKVNVAGREMASLFGACWVAPRVEG